MKEYKVGEIVTINGVKTKVTEHYGCDGCVMELKLCKEHKCKNYQRSDGISIIFKHIDSTPLPPENMRVWIRGNKERGEEVIKALADLGAKDMKWPDGKDPNVLYYIDTDRIISSTKDSHLLAYFLMNNFKEIKLPYKPKDKELVWAWDNDYPFSRHLSFYDAQHNCTFCSGDGTRIGVEYSHYAPYGGEWPEWAKEAQKKLEE